MAAVHLTLLGAIQWAFNFVASAAFLTFLSLLIKTKSDAGLKIKELEQLQAASEKGGVREDNKLALETDKFALERQKIANDRAEKQYNQVCGDRDYWAGQYKTAQAELDMRNTRLAESGTNYPEMFSLMVVPGAMECLRKYRDHYQSQASSNTLEGTKS